MGDLFEVEKADGNAVVDPVAAEESATDEVASEAPVTPTFIRQTSSVAHATTFIRGEIVSEGDITISRRLEADISAKGNASISGMVTGNVSADRIDLSAGTVNGNVTAAQSISLDSTSNIVGDVSSETLNTDGTIQGDVKVHGKAIFLAKAKVKGQISAGSLSVENGARLRGNVYIIEESEPASFGD